MKKNLLILMAILLAATSCDNQVMESLGKKASDRKEEVASKLRHRQRTEPVSVNAIRVRYTDDVSSTVLVGNIESSKSTVVSNRYPGCVKQINVHKGQHVDAGELLAVLDAETVNAAYDAAKAVYDQAKDALDRVEKVYQSGSIPEVKLMEIKTEVAKAEASLRSARKAKNDCNICAPYSGVIGDIYPHAGEELQAMSPVVQMLDLSSIEVHAALPENEYASYETGMRAVIEVPATGTVTKAVLAIKGVEASKLTKSYDCTFKFLKSSATAGIMPGMLCKVRLIGNSRNAIVIPSSAVMIDGEGRYVWCCNEGTVMKKHIVSGGFSGKGIIVTEGLEEGDMLVVEGSRKISDGMKGVKVVDVTEE